MGKGGTGTTPGMDIGSVGTGKLIGSIGKFGIGGIGTPKGISGRLEFPGSVGRCGTLEGVVDELVS